MSAKTIAVIMLLGSLLFVSALAIPVQAQRDLPASLTDALVDLGRRVGKPLKLADFNNSTSRWEVVPKFFADTGLECPQAGRPSKATQTEGFDITLVYYGVRYNYRAAAADRNTLILCSTTSAVATPGPISLKPIEICPSNLPMRLAVGKRGRVLPGGPNRLRLYPNVNSELLGLIPVGGVFTVEDGPRCQNGLRFWQVNYQGTIGWTVEGKDGQYWVAPE